MIKYTRENNVTNNCILVSHIMGKPALIKVQISFQHFCFLCLGGVSKPVFEVSDQVRHIATEDGYSLEISDLGRRGIELSL